MTPHLCLYFCTHMLVIMHRHRIITITCWSCYNEYYSYKMNSYMTTSHILYVYCIYFVNINVYSFLFFLHFISGLYREWMSFRLWAMNTTYGTESRERKQSTKNFQFFFLWVCIKQKKLFVLNVMKTYWPIKKIKKKLETMTRRGFQGLTNLQK